MIHHNLEIEKVPRELMIEIYTLTVQLSKIHIFGEADQFNHSLSSATQSLAATCGQRHYPYEFIKKLVNDQDINQSGNHLETLFEEGRLTHENFYAALKNKSDRLYHIVNGFRQSEQNQPIHHR